jgi:DNA-directed RNA polymerase beta subunit
MADPSFTEAEFRQDTWSVIEKYFDRGSLVAHQIGSFNDFLLRKVPEVIHGFNDLVIQHGYVPDHDAFQYELRLQFQNPLLARPVVTEKDGSVKIMLPSMARERNLSYCAPLTVDVYVSASVLQSDGTYLTENKKLSGVSLGRIPIMIKSKYCVLNTAVGYKHNECKHEPGGYFIVNGNEKVVISQDRIAENRTACFVSNKLTHYSHIAEIRSVADNICSVPKATVLKLSSRANHFGRYIRVNIHHIKADVPLFVIFRALGVESDRDISQYIVQNMDQNELLLRELVGSIEDANMIRTERQALEYLSRHLNISGYPKEILNHPDRRIGIVRNILVKELLPHVGPLPHKKALYLGHMCHKLLSCYLELQPFDDRDSYINKRIDTPGILLTNLFRQYYGKLIKDVRNLLQKEIVTGAWRATGRFVNILTRVNVTKIIKPTIIETGLKYCLATGNWGVKNARNKQGIAQVLNRMSYHATLSHLRRLNTPVDKTGKLVQPRKLHPTQWGIICPAESPDGASVGLVKNMAVMANVTTSSNSTHVRGVLCDLGLHPFNSVRDLDDFSKYTWVQVNGDFVGIVKNAGKVFEEMRSLKRHGHIDVHTAIVWDPAKRLLRISTESGRCVRPVYIVRDDGTLALTRQHVREGVSWMTLVNGRYAQAADGTSALAPAIEYIDVEEANSLLIAMRLSDLSTRSNKYTHMEIHPALLLGVLAGTIPFSDHNQAPRNCYQCLDLNEPVLMAGGTRKCIKNVVHGDVVITFDPETMHTTPSKVVQHVVRPTHKRMFAVTTTSGRVIRATYDHKFMTSAGWKEVADFSDETLVGIHLYPQHASPAVDECVLVDADAFERVLPLSATLAAENRIKKLLPLRSTSVALPTLARLGGYLLFGGGKATFAAKQDALAFQADLLALGAEWLSLQKLNGVFRVFFDVALAALFEVLDIRPDAVPRWVARGSPLVKREFLAGLFGAHGCSVQWSASNPEMAWSCASCTDALRAEVTELLEELGVRDTVSFCDCVGFRYNTRKIVECGKTAEYHKQKSAKADFDEWTQRVQAVGHMLFVPIESVVEIDKGLIADITVESDNHDFIAGDGFAVHNSAMGKQAVGVYASNFRQRYDTMAHVLNYPQQPLVQTRIAKMLCHLPSGQNAIVAISTGYGYNQEDSIIMNKSSVDRGLFTSTYYRTYREQAGKNHANGEEEFFTKPDLSNTKNLRPFKYDKVGEDGFVPENTAVEGNDVIIGRCMPQKSQALIINRDTSVALKNNEHGFVDRNAAHDRYFINTNGDGYTFAKVRIRSDRVPAIGDKFSSVSGQKGTIGMLYRQEDMPFCPKDGLVPDIIINPHAIPSRMTIGQLLETLLAQTCCMQGVYGDGTPFMDMSLSDITRALEEKCGMQRFGDAILHDPRTGRQLDTLIFIGPCFYQRLKHMVVDKIHCLKPDHDVLTTRGWLPIAEVTREDQVATLQDGKLVYASPLEVLHYPDYSGKMYHVSNQAIDLDVTLNHRMLVSKRAPAHRIDRRTWTPYELVTADQVVGKVVRYKKDAEWDKPDYQFVLPTQRQDVVRVFDMDAWLKYLGMWIAKGWTTTGNKVQMCQCKPRVRDIIADVITDLGYDFHITRDEITICNVQLHAYLSTLSVGAPYKRLPEWVWLLSQRQAQILLMHMVLGDGTRRKNSMSYCSSSTGLADDATRLSVHAGWSGTKHLHIPSGRKIVNAHDIWRVSIIQARNMPTVNHGHHKQQQVQTERVYDYTGPVHCLTVPGGVFYVRRNGKPVWTGNSRSQQGPVVLLTRQPAEGRARDGGLRLGEMEVECLQSHGILSFLKERMQECSDGFKVHICRKCGSLAIANSERNRFDCRRCKNRVAFSEVRIPYSLKLLVQEIEAMGIGTKFITHPLKSVV